MKVCVAHLQRKSFKTTTLRILDLISDPFLPFVCFLLFTFLFLIYTEPICPNTSPIGTENLATGEEVNPWASDPGFLPNSPLFLTKTPTLYCLPRWLWIPLYFIFGFFYLWIMLKVCVDDETVSSYCVKKHAIFINMHIKKHAIPKRSGALTFYPLDCQIKKMTTVNTTVAAWCQCIKIISIFCQITKNIFLVCCRILGVSLDVPWDANGWNCWYKRNYHTSQDPFLHWQTLVLKTLS